MHIWLWELRPTPPAPQGSGGGGGGGGGRRGASVILPDIYSVRLTAAGKTYGISHPQQKAAAHAAAVVACQKSYVVGRLLDPTSVFIS